MSCLTSCDESLKIVFISVKWHNCGRGTYIAIYVALLIIIVLFFHLM